MGRFFPRPDRRKPIAVRNFPATASFQTPCEPGGRLQPLESQKPGNGPRLRARIRVRVVRALTLFPILGVAIDGRPEAA